MTREELKEKLKEAFTEDESFNNQILTVTLKEILITKNIATNEEIEEAKENVLDIYLDLHTNTPEKRKELEKLLETANLFEKVFKK